VKKDEPQAPPNQTTRSLTTNENDASYRRRLLKREPIDNNGMFNIEEYNGKKTKAEFHQFVSNWASEIISLTELRRMFDRDRADKLMYEEALALRKYMIRYYRHLDILIEPCRGSQNYDAVIYDDAESLIEYVEITGVPRADDHVLRAEMAEHGFYPRGSVAHQCPSFNAYAARVLEAIEKKKSKTYPTPCTLLVVLSPDMVVEEDKTFNYIIRRLDPRPTAGQFARIVAFDLPGTHWAEFR
jgi:hypothetical protein